MCPLALPARQPCLHHWRRHQPDPIAADCPRAGPRRELLMSQAEGFTGKAVTLTWPEDKVALATLTRAKEMNTLSLDLIAELNHAMDVTLAAQGRALIIIGSGRGFCCGAHLDYFTDPN